MCTSFIQKITTALYELLRLRYLSSCKRHNFNQRDKETNLNVDLFRAKNQQLNLLL